MDFVELRKHVELCNNEIDIPFKKSDGYQRCKNFTIYN